MFETAYQKLKSLRNESIGDVKYLYLSNTKKRDGTYFIYKLKDINQRIYHTFKANGFYWAIQYANTWAKENNAIIVGTTLSDCKDYVNRSIKYPCGTKDNLYYDDKWVKYNA